MKREVMYYYHWDEFEEEICRRMGITKYQFKHYHEVIGGDDKCLWDEWVDWFDPDLYNDRMSICYAPDIEEIYERVDAADNKQWVKPFIEVVVQLLTESVDEDGNIGIWYHF